MNKKNKTVNTYEKKTYITINSKDRNIKNTFYKNKYFLNNIKFTLLNSKTILITHPNHNFKNHSQILFKNLQGNYNYDLNINTLLGIPIDYLNFNNQNNTPIFIINVIYDNNNISNSYTININFNIDNHLLEINNFIIENNFYIEFFCAFNFSSCRFFTYY